MRFGQIFSGGSTVARERAAAWLATLLCLLAVSLPAAPAQATRVLQAVSVATLDGNRARVTLTLSGPVPKPVIFVTDQPVRPAVDLSMDLQDTHLALSERYKAVDIGTVRSYAVAEGGTRTRVVFELSKPTPYVLRVQGNQLIVEFGAVSGAASAPIPVTARTAPTAVGPVGNVQAAAAPPTFADIDFRRGDRGEGRVMVTLNDARASMDVREEGGKVIARFHNTALPDRLAKRLDVLDFATPAKFVDAQRSGRDVEVVVTPVDGGDFERNSYQDGTRYVLELAPLSQEKLEQKRRDQPEFTGERISLSFQSVDIRALLQIIADVAHSNIVVSDSVQGQLAMRLANVPWDQALDIILRTKGLGMRRQGNVMLVAPLEEMAQREKLEMEADKQNTQLAPLRSELIQVNYAKAAELGALIKSKSNSVLSERGNVTIDERTNTLLVLESREKIAEIRTLVQRLDIPVRQVLIEARIVVASDNFNRQLGVQFGVTGSATSSGGNLFSTSGTGSATNTAVNGYLNNGRSGAVPVSDNANGERYNVNLPVTNPAGSLALAVLTKNVLVDLELSALQAEGRGQVVSSPHVITANSKQASIEQGVEIPYQESTSSGATSVAFKKAVLSLAVTPQITPDERVIMDLAVSNDTVGQNVSTGNGGTAPSIDTRKVTTQVLVENGQTVVLGGIYEQTLTDEVTKVPLLGDIPLVGNLFRNTNHTNNKSELLVFITPKILSEALTSSGAGQ